jgi:hypothetical protein
MSKEGRLRPEGERVLLGLVSHAARPLRRSAAELGQALLEREVEKFLQSMGGTPEERQAFDQFMSRPRSSRYDWLRSHDFISKKPILRETRPTIPAGKDATEPTPELSGLFPPAYDYYPLPVEKEVLAAFKAPDLLAAREIEGASDSVTFLTPPAPDLLHLVVEQVSISNLCPRSITVDFEMVAFYEWSKVLRHQSRMVDVRPLRRVHVAARSDRTIGMRGDPAFVLPYGYALMARVARRFASLVSFGGRLFFSEG